MILEKVFKVLDIRFSRDIGKIKKKNLNIENMYKNKLEIKPKTIIFTQLTQLRELKAKTALTF